MKVQKRTARFHSIVFTERSPSERFEFEQKIDHQIKSNVGSNSVFIRYIHDLDKRIYQFGERVKILNRFFGEIADRPFQTQYLYNNETGHIVVFEWKNPQYNILNRQIPKFTFS